MADSSVKVGVRIRPLLAKEQHQNNILNNCDETSIQFRNQGFTFDHVFGIDMSQEDLYEQTAASMLKSFLDGYNVTIMAYGQTGSGKSYTMGTSETTLDHQGNEGLIPRFVYDLFENLSSSQENEQISRADISVSFLEIYGEDVFDLIPAERDGKVGPDRPSLNVRENETGNVIVQGLHQVKVDTADAAVNYLYSGMKNRITASTLMNAGSSRSHAVYVITLEQTSGGEDEGHKITSKLTFVDLAGSERIGRTQAEGKLKKEGIQINSGLFCLGQVINGLADDQRLKNGIKQTHIPYRNSKLTHLLKDALGGNSQTLFLACVSPADSNESETHSTLIYAKAARNIKNKPVRNMDKTQMEIIRLRYAVKAWTLKAVSHMVQDGDTENETGTINSNGKRTRMSIPLPDLSPSHPSQRTATGANDSNQMLLRGLLDRADIQDYIRSVNRAIDEKLEVGITTATPRKVRLSMGVCAPREGGAARPPGRFGGRAGTGTTNTAVRSLINAFDAKNSDSTTSRANTKRSSRDDGKKDRDSGSSLDLPDPEESEKLVARMQEMVAQEKELLEREADGEAEIQEVDRAIEEKEEILTKLMETVKGFTAIKVEYEKLVEEIGTLESERLTLETELERAKRSDHHGSSKTTSVAQLEGMKSRYEKVKQELEVVREEKKRKENAYKVMQREAKSCDALQQELQKLKETKVSLMREQKASAVQVQKLKKEQAAYAIAFKRTDVEKTRQMNTLKSELTKKERVLGMKDKEMGRVYSKLKACEEHITQLLRLNRTRSKMIYTTGKSTAGGASPHLLQQQQQQSAFAMTAAESDHLGSSKALLENLINDRVLHTCAKAVYERKSRSLLALNKELEEESREMERLMQRLTEEEDGSGTTTADIIGSYDAESAEEAAGATEATRRAVCVGEGNIDRITRELDVYNADLDEIAARISFLEKSNNGSGFEKLGQDIVSSLKGNQLHAFAWELIQEKLDALEALRVTQDLVEEMQDAAADYEDKIRGLEKALQSSNKDFKTKLNQAEKQRTNDLWSVMKAKPVERDNDRDNISQLVDSVGQAIAIQRAFDLERELEEYVQTEARLRHSNEELLARVHRMELAQQAGGGGGGSTAGNNALTADNVQLSSLLTLWLELGVSTEQREHVLSEIKNAGQLSIDRFAQQAQADLSTAAATRTEHMASMQLLCDVFGIDQEQYVEDPYPNATLSEINRDLLLSLGAMEAACADKVHLLFTTKERVLDLVSEMWLGTHDISPQLQALLKLTKTDQTVLQLATQLSAAGIVVTEATVEQWRNEISKLNVKRAAVTGKAIAAKDAVIKLADDLSLDATDLQNVAVGADVSKDALLAAVALVSAKSASNPPGSAAVLSALEQLHFALQSVKLNREQVTQNLADLTHFLSCYCDREAVKVNPDTKYFKPTILQFFELSTDLVTQLCTKEEDLMSQLRECVQDMGTMVTNLADSSPITIGDLLKSAKKGSSTDLFQPMTKAVENMEGISVLIDESWLQDYISELISFLATKRDELIKIIGLRRECNDIHALSSGIKQVRKLDQQLSEQVAAMETFETNSKLDRQKVLNGSSKLLVYEESFRKQSKKKFESLTDQILNCVCVIRQLSSGRFVVDFSALSAHSLDLIQGKAQEKTELMHLHTTTHGTRRWSGDRELTDAPAEPSTEAPVDRTPSPPTGGYLMSYRTGQKQSALKIPAGESAPSATKARAVSPSKGRAVSPSKGRALSPLKTRAASPTRTAGTGTGSAQPVWYPHTKPSKPAPMSTVKKMYSSEDASVSVRKANSSEDATENEHNGSARDSIYNPLSKPSKPPAPAASKKTSGVEEAS